MTTIRRFTPAIGFILASMSIVTSPMAAQRTDAATLCKIAQDSIAAGAFTSNATTGLLYCGSSAATVLSTLISQSGSSQDAGRFSLINRIAPQIRSQSIVNSALTVAQTVGNTQASRVASFQVLAAEFNNIFQFASPTPGAPIEACALSGSGGNSAYYYDEGLARSLGQQIMTLASAVYHNTNDDPVVRSAAYCVRQALHSNFPFPINTSLITLAYVCGDKFRIHNGNAEFADLAWNTYNVPPDVRPPAPTLTSGGTSVPGNSDGYIFTDNAGTARLYYQSQLIQTRANSRTVCH
jgi:hypothetical protein